MAERLRNDPRVEALRPYGLRLPPAVRSDKGVQFGKALRIPLTGHADFWRVGITTTCCRLTCFGCVAMKDTTSATSSGFRNSMVSLALASQSLAPWKVTWPWSSVATTT